MNAIAIAETPEPVNVIALPATRPRKASHAKPRFKILPFKNARTGSRSWRVSGSTREGIQVRENFREEAEARARQIELETEYLRGHAETNIRATKLSAEQVQLAEVAFIKLGDDWTRLLDCVDHWKRTGAKNIVTDAPRIDEAVDAYLEWLKAGTFRDATKRHWRGRMTVFKNSVPNMRVSDFTPEHIEKYLAGRNTSAGGKDTDRRAVSRFFSWCIERPRRWAMTNPCREVRVAKGEKTAPSVLTVKECEALLRAAEAHKGGLLVPYVAVCLFGGLRPFEASRLNWRSVNLKDAEIRLEANQVKTGRKTGRGRVVEICDTLKRWLKGNQDKEFFPANWRKEFDAVREAAGITEWPHDVLRHTAISHHFRFHNSYGKAAEQFGNSETIIKTHYQGRVSSDETKKFYALAPKKGARKSP
jgi:integrase